MDYKKIYNQIIERAKSEERKKKCGIYYESHHIKPKCLVGDENPKNLVLLTAKEHFLCHKLLVIIYPGEKSLIFALWMMSNGSNNHRNKYLEVSVKDYEYSRNLYSESRKDFVYTEEMRKKMSDSQKGKVGEKNSFYGKKHTEESRKKMSESAKNRKASEETKKKMSIIRKGRKHTEESRKKMSDSAKNKIVSDETKLKLSKLRKGVKLSEEQKIKISKSMKGIEKPKTSCDICGREIATIMLDRHKNSCINKNNVGDSH